MLLIKYRCSIIVIFLQCLCLHFYGRKPVNLADNITIQVASRQDSLTIRLITDVPTYQLSFLMQGLHINLLDSASNFSAKIVFPNAMMVRDKIKHHPNEVKAMHYKNKDEEIRPDLQPLISALNGIPPKVLTEDGIIEVSFHKIEIEKENGILNFTTIFKIDTTSFSKDSIVVELTSFPIGHTSEYNGRRLSQENRMPLHGLGNVPSVRNMEEREVRIRKKLKVL